jgi:hypothetical protein
MSENEISKVIPLCALASLRLCVENSCHVCAEPHDYRLSGPKHSTNRLLKNPHTIYRTFPDRRQLGRVLPCEWTRR